MARKGERQHQKCPGRQWSLYSHRSVPRLQCQPEITAGRDCRLAEWIIDDSCLVTHYFFLSPLWLSDNAHFEWPLNGFRSALNTSEIRLSAEFSQFLRMFDLPIFFLDVRASVSLQAFIHSAFVRQGRLNVWTPHGILEKTYRTRQVSSMNHSARPIVTPVASERCFLLFCFSRFEKWGRGRTDGRTICAKTMIPTGRDFRLAEWINYFVFKIIQLM